MKIFTEGTYYCIAFRSSYLSKWTIATAKVNSDHTRIYGLQLSSTGSLDRAAIYDNRDDAKRAIDAVKYVSKRSPELRILKIVVSAVK